MLALMVICSTGDKTKPAHQVCALKQIRQITAESNLTDTVRAVGLTQPCSQIYNVKLDNGQVLPPQHEADVQPPFAYPCIIGRYERIAVI